MPLTDVPVSKLSTLVDRTGIPRLMKILRDEIETRLAALETSEQSAQGFTPIPITTWTEGSAPLIAFADGSENGLQLTDSEALSFRFGPVGEDTSTLTTTVPIPPDLDDTADVVLHVLCARIGANDVAAVLVGGAFFHTVGAAHTADADAITVNSAAIAEATTIIAEKTLTIDAADVQGAPASLTLTLTVDAALDEDDLIITTTWLEYTKKLLES